MSCDEIQQELVGYHFGIVEPDEARRRLEDHLVSCQACIEAFVALKRDIETAESGPRPSAAVRQRLRLAVAEELGVAAPPSRRWSWWERPLALGFAGVAVFLAMLAVGVIASSPGSMPHSMIAPASEARPAPPHAP
jgi:anti-sigma factor RsiW